MGRPADPAYWREWRAAHPEYRARERERRRGRPRGWNARERESQRLRRQRQRADHGWTESGHPVMDQAARVAARYVHPDMRSLYTDALYEEALMTAALAILEEQDPHEAVREVLHRERLWRWRTRPLQ